MIGWGLQHINREQGLFFPHIKEIIFSGQVGHESKALPQEDAPRGMRSGGSISGSGRRFLLGSVSPAGKPTHARYLTAGIRYAASEAVRAL